MRIFGIFVVALLAIYPTLATAQNDPDWARREMERMQAEQERFNAQVERQRAEQERMVAQQDRQAAEVARRRAEQERQAPSRRDENFSTYVEPQAITREIYGASQLLTGDQVKAVFEVANEFCPRGPDDLIDAMLRLNDEESQLLAFFCGMYFLGQVHGSPEIQTAPAEN